MPGSRQAEDWDGLGLGPKLPEPESSACKQMSTVSVMMRGWQSAHGLWGLEQRTMSGVDGAIIVEMALELGGFQVKAWREQHCR